jgi:EmrB/QacA subfamily drug resistance transporter
VTAVAPAPIRLRSRTGAALITATVLASMAGFLDASVVNVAIPAIGRDLGAGVVALQWTLTGYLLTAAALLLVAGAFADKFGRRRVLIVGLGVMLVASVLCSVAPSAGVLIIARIVQGAGAALVVPSSLALLNGTLPTEDRAPGIGIWAGLSSLGGLLIGPFAGGWLVDHASWRAIFLLNIPLIVGALVALIPVPEAAHTAGGRLSIDWTGAALAVLGLGGLIDALTAGPADGWTTPRVIAGLVVGVVCLAALVPVERRLRAPMLKLSLFESRQFSAINVATVLLYGALAAAGYLLVLRCELTLGWSATKAGSVQIPASAVFLALSPVSGVLVRRLGPRLLMTAGIVAIGLAFLWLAIVRGGYAGAILPAVLLWGVGLGLTVTPLTAAVLAAVGDGDLGEASAISDVASRLGGAVLTALVPVLIGVHAGRGLGPALVQGYRPAMIVLAVLCAAAAVISAVFVRTGRPATAPAPARFAPPAPFHGCALPAVHTSPAVHISEATS